MNKLAYCFALLLTLLLASCSSGEREAQERLLMARKALLENDFAVAKSHLDSLQTLYPKAFDQRKAALAFLDTVRQVENDYNIKICDSLMAYYQPKIDSMKQTFTYVIDKEYQESGSFVPKDGWNAGRLASTTLRSGVSSDGQLYLESIYIGGNQIHNKIRVSTKDAEPVESLPIEGDGFNFRFASQGKQYEIMKISPSNDNGVAKFIVDNKDKVITMTLDGSSKYSYTLSASVKKSIAQSVELSKTMLLVDSLNEEKTKSAYKNYKLNEKKEKQTTNANGDNE